MGKSMKIGLVLLFLVIAGLGIWWFLAAPLRVVTVTPSRGPAVDAVYATGTVEPIRWSKIATTVTGRIIRYPAEEGAKVARNDVLVQLDDSKAKAVLRELEARFAFLEGDLKRYQLLVERGTVSRQAYERVKSDLDQAQAVVAVARQRLADTTITAPLDGVVLRKDGEVGEVVQADDVLLWIGQDRPYWITADVDEEDIPWVAPGQQALIKADAFPKQVLKGEVGQITPMGDAINKQYRVRILLTADSPLMIGMTTEINIVIRAEENALLIPEASLGRDNAVWLVEDGTAQRREVELGIYGQGMVEVRRGLQESDQLILAPPTDLQDGAAVRAEPR